MKVLITSALPYANGPLHFGHIVGAYLPADCYARFERMRGHEVLFISGSDEYGVAITLSAEIAGRSPKEHVDEFHKVNQELFRTLQIDFDHFSRTTCAEHAPLVQEFFQELVGNGHIEEKETKQLYSEKDDRFLADRYVVGTCPSCGFEEARGDECNKCAASFEATDLKNPRSKLSGSPLILRKTRHLFLRFDHFKEKLATFLKTKDWRPNVVSFATKYVEDLQPRAITRDLEWGVPVPGKKDKVFYVWFDAPIGYLSASQEWSNKCGDPQKWRSFWCDPKTKYVQFLGKDNIPFHAIFFPAMMMGQNQPYKQVDELVANEFLNYEGRKFSKSDGAIIALEDFFNRFHSDQIRYCLAANAPENSDAEFTWKDFQMRCNAELLGKYGNLVNRVLVFVQNKMEGKIPQIQDLEEADHRFLNDLSRITEEIYQSYEKHSLRKVCAQIMEMAHLGNSYFDVKTPWKEGMGRETTISLCLECIKRLALLSAPLVPTSADRIWKMLGQDSMGGATLETLLEKPLEAGSTLPKPSILFQKVEDDVIDMELEKLAQPPEMKEPPYPPLKEMINFDDFCKLDLRVGLIVNATKVPKSKKLLQLEVDIGLEKRTIVSGISLHYSPEELVGKKVAVVANLKPAKLMGIESQGMVLAGCLDEALEVVMIEDLPAGSQIS